MFAIKSLVLSLVLSLLAILVLVSSAAATPVDSVDLFARTLKPPKGWNAHKFENYKTYHHRYMALDCPHEHNTDFFTQCCGPLLKHQKLSTRPDECDPSKETVDACDD